MYAAAVEVVAYYKVTVPCGLSPISLVYRFYNVAASFGSPCGSIWKHCGDCAHARK